MTGMENYRIWVMSLLEYDRFGNATVIKSYAKPAHDSKVKQKKKEKEAEKRIKSSQVEEKQLWD